MRAKLPQELLVALRRYSRTHRIHQIVDPLIDIVRSFSLGIGIGLGPATVTLSSAAGMADFIRRRPRA